MDGLGDNLSTLTEWELWSRSFWTCVVTGGELGANDIKNSLYNLKIDVIHYAYYVRGEGVRGDDAPFAGSNERNGSKQC